MKENGDVQNLKKSQNNENFEGYVEEFRPLLELYDEFEQLFSNPEEYPVAAFWNSYLDIIQTLRDIIKSIKNGDCDLHMYAFEKMLYWFHAYGSYNYARHFSYYWASQQVLHKHHPAIYEEFKERGFTVRRTFGKFNKVSPDQVIKQTVNKDQKGLGT